MRQHSERRRDFDCARRLVALTAALAACSPAGEPVAPTPAPGAVADPRPSPAPSGPAATSEPPAAAGAPGPPVPAAPAAGPAAPPRAPAPPAPAAALPYPDHLLCPAPVAQATEGRLSPGFAAQCAGCHGPAGEGRTGFPALGKRAELETFVSIVRTGRAGMPAFDEASAPRGRLEADFRALSLGAAGSADPDCGPGARELPAHSADELAARIERGMAAFRQAGPKGACAGCHAATAIDLAFIGYSDADILRRALPQVGAPAARAIVDLVHALRTKHAVERPLHPRRFRFLQPGHDVLPELRQPMVYPQGTSAGERDAARDAAFAQSLSTEVGLRLVGAPIRTVAEARAAERQLLDLDLRRLRVGVPFPRWTEDGFHGEGTRSPNEWVALLARRPKPAQADAWHALVDAYAAAPTDVNLWRMYDAIEALTEGDAEAPLAARWSLRKFQSVQVAAHMLLGRTTALPDRLAGAPPMLAPADRRALDIARNPFWRVGDSVRQNPLNCNQPDPCMRLPLGADATVQPGDLARERQSYEEKMSWFWLGFVLDPALVVTEDSLATVTGDYFLALSQPWYQVHNAFLVAAIVTAKANARAFRNVDGVALPGHGLWASPRPFMAFKHSERELHHPPRNDLRHGIHERLWANSFRMFLLLMNDELARTNEVFDRARTRENVAFMRQWFGKALELGQDHRELDTLVAEIGRRLAAATEIGRVTGY